MRRLPGLSVSGRRCPAALVTIHDVTPRTLDRVRGIAAFLEAMGVDRFSFLVVPATGWTPGNLADLRQLLKPGRDVAGHGWRHRVRRVNSGWHRLHGKIMSGNEAEHLSLSEAEIAGLVRRCFEWFREVGLPLPRVYVPPAWAMGRLSRGLMSGLPFECYETLWGLYHVDRDRHELMPLSGYMADGRFRARVLKGLNAVSVRLPVYPERIAIHPDDLRLPLRDDLERRLRRFRRFATYADMIDKTRVSPDVLRDEREATWPITT